MIDQLRPSRDHGFWQPAVLLAGLTCAIALLLLPIAMGRSDSGGVRGLAIAASLCLVTGWLAEGVACALSRHVMPLVILFTGMMIRMLPPMAVCGYLALSGAGGRQNLAFIGYLLAFYLATLALETYLAVKRLAPPSKSKKTAS